MKSDAGPEVKFAFGHGKHYCLRRGADDERITCLHCYRISKRFRDLFNRPVVATMYPRGWR